MIQVFINKPVLSTVISIFILLLGYIGLTVLPVTEYPDIAPPTIVISANYTGANAETVLESVIIPIEEQVNGVENMNYITSTAGSDGSAKISVFFKQGTDPDMAVVNVQNRVARANALLPAEVVKAGVVTQKQQTSSLMYLSFLSKNKQYDETFLQNYLNINIIPALKRINGVGDASVFGVKDYSMRIWLEPQKLANYQLTPQDVITAINEQSAQVAAGQLGQNIGESFSYTIKYSGKYNEVEQFKKIVLKTGTDGQLLRLQDVATVELSSFSFATKGETDKMPSLTMAIYQTPGSNAQQIIKDIKVSLEQSKQQFPDGIEYLIIYDSNDFLEASMENVIHTLIEAFLLVFLVVFIFLQDFRSTLIPAIAVPVSIVGTFFVLNIFGFSLNLLTLFALILAIGIVVDDAIVVVEAVHAKMQNNHKLTVKEATMSAMNDISGAIISITLVMAAVFIPVTFISGPTGVFYKQFGITLAVAIVISAINALTLSPTLCALLLKPHQNSGESTNLLKRFYAAFNTGFEVMSNKYGRITGLIIRQKWIMAILVVASGLAIYWANATTPTGFVPNEDRGLIFADVQLPPGATLDRTYQTMKTLEAKASQIPGIKSFSFTAGNSLVAGAGNNFGFALINLSSFEERSGIKEQSSDAIVKQLFGISVGIPEARMIFFGPPSVPGFGLGSGFEAQFLDRSGGKHTTLDANTKAFILALSQRPEILYAMSPFSTAYPQYQMTINTDLAKAQGVKISEIFSALSGYVGGNYAADFTKFGKQYRVMIQSLPESRKDLNSLNNIYVRNASGNMSPITQYVKLERVLGPQTVTRFNLYNSASFSGAPAPGYSTGDAVKALQETAATTLPNGYGIDYSGLTREEIAAGSQTALIFLLTLVFVYFLLAAQYESYILPFAIILSLPFGVMGAYLSQKYAGLENNIFFQIALIMLIGLLAKNAILIVEFALQRRNLGDTIVESAINGAKERLRPILMTSFAFILGLMPLVLAKGVGELSNRSLATGAALGLLIGTFFGLLVIPGLYVVFQTLQEKIKPIIHTTDKQETH